VHYKYLAAKKECLGGSRHSDKEIFRSDLNRPKSCEMSERLLKTLRKSGDFASSSIRGYGSRLSARGACHRAGRRPDPLARLAGTTKVGASADGEAHGSASTAPTNADGGPGRTEDDWNPPRASALGRTRGIPARMPRMGRRDPNDGRGFVSAVASCVIPFQETREFVAIEPPPARVQAGEEFEFVACGKRHVGPIAKCHYIFCIPANCRPL
jgi:hypothetical protein